MTEKRFIIFEDSPVVSDHTLSLEQVEKYIQENYLEDDCTDLVVYEVVNEYEVQIEKKVKLQLL